MLFRSDIYELKYGQRASFVEQTATPVDSDPRVEALEIAAGHVEVVGEAGNVPIKLIEALQRTNILAATPVEREAEMAVLLRALYR